MQAEIITIGDEILIGQIVDSNSAFLGQELNKIGVSVYQITSIQDNRDHIRQALEAANQRSQWVIVTGGLGPTKDDVTKEALCDFFEDTLVQDSEVLAHIESLFKKYINTPISDLNRQQALVPSTATVLHNGFGTAPGLWLEKKDTVFTFMPGVPYEMKGLITKEILPRIKKKFKRPHILHRTLLTYGLGESAIANRIETWETTLPHNIKLAYLPSLGRVRLRLSGKGSNKADLKNQMDQEIEKVLPLINDIYFGEEEDGGLELAIGKALTEKGMTLATAESFTGGKIAERITAIPGASAYYKGTVVSYATETKIKVLGIDKKLIASNSVVSEEVAIAMAKKATQLMEADFAIATTGNAGPTKGDADTEVGTVFIAIATPKKVFALEFTMGNHRKRVVTKSVNKALELLYREIVNF